VQQRSLDWPLDDLSFDHLAAGLRRVYRRGHRAMALSYEDPQPDHFHEWRKRVKYLWHQLELLEPAWPGVLAAFADETHDLSDLLGDEHDRTVLETMIRERPDLVEDPDVGRNLAVALDDQRAELRTAARPLGAKIYAESPEQFTGRITCYWRSGRLPE
jgi:CHAD domain-containing protein